MQKRIPAVFAALLASCIVSTTGQRPIVGPVDWHVDSQSGEIDV